MIKGRMLGRGAHLIDDEMNVFGWGSWEIDVVVAGAVR